MSEKYSIDATMVNGEIVGTPKLTVPHPILLKFVDLLEFYQTLPDKSQEIVDKELDFFIQRSIAKTIAKYNVNKREKKVASELKQWSEALLLLFYDMEDTDYETTDL